MAATQNFNSNEENEVNLIEDDLNDPDIEARLYGEIYYSNDTYPDNPLPQTQVNPTNELNRSHHWSIDTQPGQSSKSPLVYAVNHNSQEFSPQDHYPKRKRHRALLDDPIDFSHPPKNPRNSPGVTQYPKKQDDVFIRGKFRRSRDRNTSPWRDNEVFMAEEEGEPDSTSLTALDDALTIPDASLPRKSPETSHNSSKSVVEASQGHSDSNSMLKEPEQVPVIQESSENEERDSGIVKDSKNEIERKKSKKKKGRKVYKSAPTVAIIDSDEVFMAEEEEDPDSTSLTALDDALTIPDASLPKKSPETSHNSSKSVVEASQGHSDSNSMLKEPEQVPVIQESSENEERDSEIVKNSKYEIKGKKSKKKKGRKEYKSAPTVETGDSDDSILEVPVPPKPPPPLISLPDSDDSSSSSDDESLVIMNKKTEKSVNTSKDSSSSSSGSSIIVDDSDDTGDDDEGEVIDDNLIINCTSVQRGVSSIQEIKRMRNVGDKNIVVSQDDEESMTESEAMNWGSLEGEISGGGGGLEGISQGQAVADLLHELSDGSDCRKNLLEDSEVSEKSSGIVDEGLRGMEDSVGREDESREEDATGGDLNEDGGTSGGEKRKNEGDVSSRKKRKENRKDMSFEEYMLQPMPKGLRDYYNEPKGGDILRDVRDIQRDMPKNPNRWAILDKDLCRVQRKKKSVCAICQREGHLRSRCPERPKAPTCHICGVMGHMEPRCPYNKQCISCGRKYATCRKTCEYCNRLRCSQCNGRGHASANCPDNWRKYHQTTSGTTVNIPTSLEKILKPSNQLSCSNCSRRGHEATTCTNFRWSGHFIQPCYVRDYTIGPTYISTPSQPQELPRVDFREPINLEHLGINENNPSTYLFHFLNPQSPDTTTWKESSLVPNHLQDANYPSPTGKPIYPKFLHSQFANSSVPMEVIVKRSYELQGIPVIIIRTPDDESRQKLEVLIRQWLSRPPDDKELMQNCHKLPQTRGELLKILSLKFIKFGKKSSKIAWKNLEQCRNIQKRIAKKKKHIKPSGKQVALRRKIRSMMELKYACVVATYKYFLIDTEMDALTSFYNFFKEIEALVDEEIPPKLFITAVWYYFELFTPHLSPTVVSAMRIWEINNEYHVRGEGIYQERYLQLFKGLEKRGKNMGRNGNAFELDWEAIEGINDDDIEVIDITEGSEASVPVVNIEDDRISSEGKTGGNKKGSTLMDLWISRFSRLKELNKDKKIDTSWEDPKKKKEEDLRSRILFNKQLGLPEEMPLPKDTREYTPEFLEKHTNKAFEFMREKNMGKLEAKATCTLKKTAHGIADKGTLINLWATIRGELIKRKKSLMGSSTGKKGEKKKGGVS